MVNAAISAAQHGAAEEEAHKPDSGSRAERCKVRREELLSTCALIRCGVEANAHSRQLELQHEQLRAATSTDELRG